MRGDERLSSGMVERKKAEKASVRDVLFNLENEPDMEVIKMVSFEEGQEYPQCDEQDNFRDYWEFVKKHITENNIKMTGPEHQGYGVPLIQYNGKIYAFSLSYGKWGELMAEAFEPENKDKMAYCHWAWTRPEGEQSWVNPDME